MTGPWKIVEGIESIWHYHLAPVNGGFIRGLCGARTMPTHAPLNSWGLLPKHFRTSYCKKCEELAKQNESARERRPRPVTAEPWKRQAETRKRASVAEPEDRNQT